MGIRRTAALFVYGAPLQPAHLGERLQSSTSRSPLRRARVFARVEASASPSALQRRTVLLGSGALLAGLAADVVPGGVYPAAAGEAAVSDAARLLSRGTRARLEAACGEIEAAAGLQVRVVTLGEGAGGGEELRRQLQEDSARKAVLVVDSRGGNLLSVQVGDAVYGTLPRSFWIELPNRFGNQFYVRDAGVDAAVLAAVAAIRACAQPGRACATVPGVSDDQLKISVACSAAAGVIAGAAARTGGKTFNAPFVLLYSPIWSIFLVSFGLGPVLARLQGVAHAETAMVTAAFTLVAGAIWWWIPRGIGPPPDAPDNI